LPASVEMRSGIKHDQPCGCNEAMPLLNCDASRNQPLDAPAPMASPSILRSKSRHAQALLLTSHRHV
jgi:hypothetical protein